MKIVFIFEENEIFISPAEMKALRFFIRILTIKISQKYY